MRRISRWATEIQMKKEIYKFVVVRTIASMGSIPVLEIIIRIHVHMIKAYVS